MSSKKHFIKDISRRILGFLLALSLILGGAPFEAIKTVYAVDYEVAGIKIETEYEKFSDIPKSLRIQVQFNLKNVQDGDTFNLPEISYTDFGGFSNILRSSSDRIDLFEYITTDQATIEEIKDNLQGIKVGVGFDNIYDFDYPGSYNLTGTDSIVKNGSNFIIKGEHFNPQINSDKGDSPSDRSINIPDSKYDVRYVNDSSIEVREIDAGELGLKTLNVSQIDNVKNRGGTNDVDVEISKNYLDAFTITDEFDYEGLKMTPKRGERDSTVYVTMNNGFTFDEDYSVFFLENDNVNFNSEYQVKNSDIRISPDKKVLSFKVPDVKQLAYNVILTNLITQAGDNLDKYVTKQSLLGDFLVTAVGSGPAIKEIDPTKGSNNGAEVTITGLNLEEFGYIDGINNADLSDNNLDQIEVVNENINTSLFDPDGGEIPVQKIKISYKDVRDNNNDPIEVVRKITTFIGSDALIKYDPADIISSFSFSTFEGNAGGNTDDTYTVITKATTAEDETVDVTIIVETEFPNGEYERALNIVTKEDAYTFLPNNVKGEIKDVTPDKIQVVEAGVNFATKEANSILIDGSEFNVYTYEVDGEQVVNYPKVDLGGLVIKKKKTNGHYDVVRDPDTANEKAISNARIDVYNDKGDLVTGAIGNSKGSKILIYLPEGILIDEGDVDREVPRDVQVANPILDDSGNGGYFKLEEALSYVTVASGFPSIENVEPNVTALEEGEGIEVTGTNFDNEAKVYISGHEVKINSIDDSQDGKSQIIKFDSPTFPDVQEGETVLQVVNPDGGSDSYRFIFVKSINEKPEVESFAPKKGTKDTLVVVDGKNFVNRQVSVSNTTGINIYRLIGTRIYLKGENQNSDGDDVNLYNTDTGLQNGVPELRTYNAPSSNRLIQLVDNQVELANYYRAVILEENDEGNTNFYTIEYDENDNIILYDGGTKTLVGEKKNEFEFMFKDNAIKAERSDGLIYNVVVGDSTIILTNSQDPSDTFTLTLKTVYLIEGTQIVGQRAYVVDKTRIMLTIPEKVRGLYKIVAVNPDTKSGESTDLFEYFERAVVPTISKVTPSAGSYLGGYSVVIDGVNFEDNSIIYIDGIKLDEDAYRKEGNSFVIDEFPAYKGDLKEEGIDRKDVPISIENSGGGSITKSKGFTYVIPGAAPPEIVDISLQGKDEGTAATSKGGEILNIDFKYALFEEPSATEPKYKTWIEGKDAEGKTIYFDDLNGNKEFDKFIDIKNIPEDNGVGQPYFKNLDEKIDTYERYIDNDITNPNSGIFPQVYIGGKRAKIVEYKNTSGTGGYLKVVTPVNPEGDQDVYIVNNDFGISNIEKLAYEGLNPQIESMNPDSGPISGNRKTYIYGQGFDVTKYKLSKADGSGFNEISEKMPMVRFGEYEAFKDINNNTAEVSIEDQKESLTVNYAFDGSIATLDIEIDSSKTNQSTTVDDSNFIFKKQYKDYQNDKVYIDLSQIQNESGTNYPGYEYLEINVDKDVLYVKRGFAPKAELISSNEAIVYTPSYSEVKSGVRVRYINPDETFADFKYNYLNPESAPFIDDILKDNEWRPGEEIDEKGNSYRVLRVNYKGGYTIQINGGDFRQGATVKIGNLLDIANDQINEDGMPTSLSFVMPELSEDVVGTRYNFSVLNPDGASALSDDDDVVPPIFIEFTKGEPIPEIESIEPNAGLSTGGTLVTIRGNTKDTVGSFRQGLNVMFGDVEGDVQSVSYNEIQVLTPPHVPGLVNVTVENPDGERTTKEEAFTYLSDPLITAILNPKDDREVDRISSISIEGGQQIKLKGNGFMEGARVVFYPVIEEKEKDNEEQTGEDIFRKGKEFVLVSFGAGEGVEFVDSETLLVTTPEGKLDSYGIMVINPDLGASNIYEDLKYGLPQIDAPTGVVAELMYDRYIKVFWNKVDEATEYEVYVVIDDNEFELIGSTKQLSLIYEDLEPKTKYKFIVKTLGEYGESKASNESNSVKTGSTVGYEDSDEGLIDNTQIIRSGPKVNVVLGTSDYDDKELRIDLTRGEYAGANEITISMPAQTITDNDAKDIYIMANSYTARFNPMSFNNDLMEDNDNNDETGIRLRIKTDSMEYVKPVGKISKSVISDPIVIEGSYFDDKYEQTLDYMNGYINLSMDYDMQMVQMRNYKIMTLNYFDEYSDSWNPVIGNADTGYNVNGNINRAGKYIVIGSKY
ncbi:MAG: IPT/TIG domain-containing protein [Peptostreptococcaceae bacterium]|jgi:hypothetical protein|nr:IPT/TIG domain-containing protein [Peptostreptococcaceae bacterium]